MAAELFVVNELFCSQGKRLRSNRIENTRMEPEISIEKRRVRGGGGGGRKRENHESLCNQTLIQFKKAKFVH